MNVPRVSLLVLRCLTEEAILWLEGRDVPLVALLRKAPNDEPC